MSAHAERFELGSASVCLTDVERARERVFDALRRGEGGYVSVTNVHTAYLANEFPWLSDYQHGSLITVPDGMPLVWFARLRRLGAVARTSGFDLFDAVISASDPPTIKHFLLGAIPETLDAVQAGIEAKGGEVVGTYSPPFGPVSSYDHDEMVEMVTTSGANLLWVSLSAPKQEELINLLHDRLPGVVSIGVGLVFDYFAGNVARAPAWMRRTGFEWVYRLAQRPKAIPRFVPAYRWMLPHLARAAIHRVVRPRSGESAAA